MGRSKGERQSGCAHSIQHSRNASSHVTKRYKERFLCCCRLWLVGCLLLWLQRRRSRETLWVAEWMDGEPRDNKTRCSLFKQLKCISVFMQRQNMHRGQLYRSLVLLEAKQARAEAKRASSNHFPYCCFLHCWLVGRPDGEPGSWNAKRIEMLHYRHFGLTMELWRLFCS